VSLSTVVVESNNLRVEPVSLFARHVREIALKTKIALYSTPRIIGLVTVLTGTTL
jgi:hypothetical protein